MRYNKKLMNSCHERWPQRLIFLFNDTRLATITQQIVQRGIQATPLSFIKKPYARLLARMHSNSLRVACMRQFNPIMYRHTRYQHTPAQTILEDCKLPGKKNGNRE